MLPFGLVVSRLPHGSTWPAFAPSSRTACRQSGSYAPSGRHLPPAPYFSAYLFLLLPAGSCWLHMTARGTRHRHPLARHRCDAHHRAQMSPDMTEAPDYRRLSRHRGMGYPGACPFIRAARAACTSWAFGWPRWSSRRQQEAALAGAPLGALADTSPGAPTGSGWGAGLRHGAR